MNRSEPDTEQIEQTAADWFVRRRDGLVPEAETRFQAWLAADPRHGAAFAELGAAWEAVSAPIQARRGRVSSSAAPRRRPYAFAVAGLAAAVAVCFFIFAFKPVPAPLTPPGTVALRPNIDRLPDGSLAELDAEGEIVVEFTSTLRSIRLLKGRGLFSVVSDPFRPFVVTAGNVSVRAVGTVFAVSLASHEIGVVVTEGRVALAESAPADPATVAPHVAEPLLLDAGQGTVVAVPPGGPVISSVQPMSASQVAFTLAWRGKRVELTHLPLSAAADLFNQQNTVQLSIADPNLAALPISGIFWSDDPEAFVRLLETGMDVRSHRTGDVIVLERR